MATRRRGAPTRIVRWSPRSLAKPPRPRCGFDRLVRLRSGGAHQREAEPHGSHQTRCQHPQRPVGCVELVVLGLERGPVRCWRSAAAGAAACRAVHRNALAARLVPRALTAALSRSRLGSARHARRARRGEVVPTLHPRARFLWQRLQYVQPGLEQLVQSGTPIEGKRVSVASAAMLRARVRVPGRSRGQFPNRRFCASPEDCQFLADVSVARCGDAAAANFPADL